MNLPDQGASTEFDREAWIATLREHHNERDAIDNAATRPPNGEEVKTWCATFSDVYVGDGVANLIEHFDQFIWNDPESNPSNSIKQSIQTRGASWGNIRLLPDSIQPGSFLLPADYCVLPTGVSEALISYVIVTPKLVLLSSTFILNDDYSGTLQEALTRDAESRFEVLDQRVKQGSLDFAKRQIVARNREILRGITSKWFRNQFGPGALLMSGLMKNPFCIFASINRELSFAEAPRYLRLLDISRLSVAFESVNEPGLYFVYPHAFNTPAEMWAYLSTSVARTPSQMASDGFPNRFHGLISPLVMVEAVRLYLEDLRIQTESTGDSLDEISLQQGLDHQIPHLREIQLDLTVRLSRFCDGVDELVNNHFLLWNEYPALRPVDGTIDSGFAPTTANQKSALVDLNRRTRSQETSLRNLVSMTSAAIVDRDMLTFTRDLKNLTKWVLALTFVGILIAVIPVVVSVVHISAAQPLPDRLCPPTMNFLNHWLYPQVAAQAC